MEIIHYIAIFGFAPFVVVTALFDHMIFYKLNPNQNKSWKDWIVPCFLEGLCFFAGIWYGFFIANVI